MKIKNKYGKEVNVNAAKYLIDWDRAVSKPQKKVKDILRPVWSGNFVCEEFTIPSSRMRVDLINFTQGVVVEVSPKGSHSYNDFFNKNRSSFLRSVKRDMEKVKWAELNDFRYIEIDDEDLKDDERILEKILL